MLKLIRVLLLMFVVSPANAQELHTGDTLPAGLQLHDLKTGQPITTASLKGKAVIIDCWATWCAPCIEGMKDLESWQQQFKDNLVVLAVSGERPDRLKQFMKNRPGAVKIISDTAGIVSTLFPHRTIPHTVLIGTDGRVKAITAAENVSTKLVQQLIAGQPVDLPLKKDKLEFDLAAYFNSDTSLSRQFNIQPGVEGQPSFSKTYPNTAFDQRRITIVNGTMRLLYQIAYRKSFFRMADEYNGKRSFKDQEKFSIDAWIPEPDEAKLFAFLRSELSKKFVDMEVVVEKRTMPVMVLYADNTATQKLVKCIEPVGKYDGNSLSFEGKCVSVSQLADYLESFGKYGLPVEDETGLKGYYQLSFEMEPGKTSALKEALTAFGIYAKKEERSIEVVVLRKKH